MNKTRLIHDSFNKHTFSNRYFLSPPDSNGNPVTNYNILERCDCGHIQMDNKPLAVSSLGWITARLRHLVGFKEYTRMEKELQATIMNLFNIHIAPKLGDVRATDFVEALPTCTHRMIKPMVRMGPFEYQICKECGCPVFKHDYNPYSVVDLFDFKGSTEEQISDQLRRSFMKACEERGPVQVVNYYMSRLAYKGE